MIKPSDIGWGSYREFEGPFFRGRQKFSIATDPSWYDKVLAVTTATEGGTYDAVNMYDRMTVSVGLIQWGEAGTFAVSDMLGTVADADPVPINELEPALHTCGATFEKRGGVWRFVLSDGRIAGGWRGEQLFRGSSGGKKGNWSPGDKAIARMWATCIANVFQYASAQAAQERFTVPRLEQFATSSAKAALWDGTKPDNTGLPGALRAAYLSFAANLPAVASKHLSTAITNATDPKWSPGWCNAVLRQLTFGPQIAIYPERYNKIRPVIETLFGVDLPDFANDLKAQPSDLLGTAAGIQSRLAALGYEIGAIDGVMGRLTKDAIVHFQTDRGLTADGIVGPVTRIALRIDNDAT